MEQAKDEERGDYVLPCFSRPYMMNQFVNPHIGPLQSNKVLATGLYSFSDFATVGIICGVPNSFSSSNSLTISSKASDGRDESNNGKRVCIVLTE